MNKKFYICPAMVSVALDVENMMALSGVKEDDGLKVGFSRNSGNVSDAATKGSDDYDVWDE